MRRIFWLALGATLGILIVHKLSELASKLTPQGVAGNLSSALRDLADAIGGFGADVRVAMRDREDELRRGTGLDGTTGPSPRTGRHAAGD